MGSLGLPEIAFIFVLALLIFGPKKLPEIGRTLGRGMAEFRKATTELKRTINTEMALEENPVPPVLRPRRLEENDPVREMMEPPGEAPAWAEPRSTPMPSSFDDEPELEPRPEFAPGSQDPR
ncbi:MAG TPA: twin-arginine translocase TatA/TatE family subunit [Thermoanaerobaculia bacterium]|nr:twin-arginine translocase TatA/TatE family subunit [Thermoanaerobaculia bacterium]